MNYRDLFFHKLASFVNSRWLKVFISLVVFFYLFTINLKLKDRADFHADAARDILIAERMLHTTWMPFFGHENRIGYNTPLYYYFLNFLSLIFGAEYEGLQLASILSGLLGVYIFFKLLHEFQLSFWLRLFFTFAFGISSGVMIIAIELWSIHFVFSLSLLAFYFYIRQLKTKNFIYTLFSFSALILSLVIDLSAIIIAPILIIGYFKSIETWKQKYLFLFTIVFFGTFLITWLLYINVQHFGSLTGYTSYLIQMFTVKPVGQSTSLINDTLNFMFESWWLKIDFVFKVGNNKLAAVSVLVWLYVLGRITISYRQFDLIKKNIVHCILIAAVIALGYHLITGSMYLHYFVSLLFFPSLIFIISWIESKWVMKLLLNIFLVVFTFQTIQSYQYGDFGFPHFQECLKIANYVNTKYSQTTISLAYSEADSYYTWDTTKLLYCLEKVGYKNDITVLDGSFYGKYSPRTKFHSPDIKPLPSQALLICADYTAVECRTNFENKFGGTYVKSKIDYPGIEGRVMYLFSTK